MKLMLLWSTSLADFLLTFQFFRLTVRTIRWRRLRFPSNKPRPKNPADIAMVRNRFRVWTLRIYAAKIISPMPIMSNAHFANGWSTNILLVRFRPPSRALSCHRLAQSWFMDKMLNPAIKSGMPPGPGIQLNNPAAKIRVKPSISIANRLKGLFGR